MSTWSLIKSILCISLVADVKFSKGDCGQIELVKVNTGEEFINGTKMNVAFKTTTDCKADDLLEANDTPFCLMAEQSAIDENGIILDERATLIPGPCKISHCNSAFRSADSDSTTTSAEKTGDSEADSSNKVEEEEEEKPRPKSRQNKPKKGSMGGMERSVNVSCQSMCSKSVSHQLPFG